MVPRAALSLGLSPASLVRGEEPDTALDERPDQVPVGEAAGLLAAEDPDDSGVVAAVVGVDRRIDPRLRRM
jgi:hypothetical protein